jgi:7,8-dihydropterin-6-yl-methyl-4-(beta-D-ribofuranosyl)aminobenzene 5'-phosphate synthase
MKLTVLVDNNSLIDLYLLSEPALSFFIETENCKFLFDCGYSDVFVKNASKLGINLSDIDSLLFSHNHVDHTRGLKYLLSKIEQNNFNELPSLIAHPTIFRNTYLDGEGDLGVTFSRNELSKYFKIQLNAKPLYLTKDLVYLGEIPRKNDFEGFTSIGINRDEDKPDFMLDDTALVYKTDKGLVIITACSHSGICNICEYAKKICNDDRILDIIGGLHLLQPCEAQMLGTLDYIKELNLRALYACHCTDLESKVKLSRIAPVKELGSGVVLNY